VLQQYYYRYIGNGIRIKYVRAIKVMIMFYVQRYRKGTRRRYHGYYNIYDIIMIVIYFNIVLTDRDRGSGKGPTVVSSTVIRPEFPEPRN